MRIHFLFVLFSIEIALGERTHLLIGQWECALCEQEICEEIIKFICNSTDGNILYNTTVNTESLTVNSRQEVLFKVQEIEFGTRIGFISDFNDIQNNDITVVDTFPDLINVFVDRDDVKIREQTFPNQGPLYDFAFPKLEDDDYDISIIIYKCNFGGDEESK